MGQSTEELSGDIADTRRNLASDLDALQDRVSPAAIVERRKEAARGRMRSVRDKVMGTVHDVQNTASDKTSSATGSVQSAAGSVQSAAGSVPQRVEGSPLAAGLVAFGAGMVIAALIPASEKEARLGAQAVDTAKEPVTEKAKAVGQDVAGQLSDTASTAVQEVKDTAAEGADRVRSQGQSAAESVTSDAQSS